MPARRTSTSRASSFSTTCPPNSTRRCSRQPPACVDSFDPEGERHNRLDLRDEIICTIDPDDAKDYDDAISLRK